MNDRSRRILIRVVVVVLAVLALRGLGRGGDAAGTAPAAAVARDAAGWVKRVAAIHDSRGARAAAPSVALAAGTLQLTGQVVDRQYQPVAGAVVWLAGARTTTTDDSGGFAFPGLAAGTYAVTAEDGERFGQVDQVEVAADARAIMLVVTDGPGLVLHVVGEDGGGLAGVQVTAGDRVATTGPTGTIRWRTLRGYELVTFTAPHYATLDLGIDGDDAIGALVDRTVTMHPGAEVDGVVLDPSGAPAADAHVVISAAESSMTWSLDVDAAGRWHIPSVLAGRHLARAWSPAYDSSYELVFETDGVHPARGVEIRLDAGGELSGRVVDADGRPIADAYVGALPAGREHTDARGRFHATGVQPGKHYLRATSKTGVTQTAELELPRGGHVEVTLVERAASVVGRVVDAHGAPVAHPSLSAFGEGTAMGLSGDANGGFELGGVEPGDYEISAEVAGHPGKAHAKVTVRSGVTRVTLTLPETAGLTARVVAHGEPVSYFGYVLSSPAVATVFNDAVAVRSADGMLALHDLTPGTWSLELRAPGFAPRSVASIVVAPGTETDLGELELERGRAVAGRVADDRGRPIAGATVWVTANDDGPGDSLKALFAGRQSAHTDATGRYRIDGVVSAPRLTILAMHPALGTARARPLADTDTSADFVLVAGGGIDGVAPLRTAIVATAVADAQMTTATPDDGGTFHFNLLPPGDYLVGLADASGATSVVRATVTAGTRVTVHLAPAPATP